MAANVQAQPLQNNLLPQQAIPAGGQLRNRAVIHISPALEREIDHEVEEQYIYGRVFGMTATKLLAFILLTTGILLTLGTFLSGAALLAWNATASAELTIFGFVFGVIGAVAGYILLQDARDMQTLANKTKLELMIRG